MATIAGITRRPCAVGPHAAERTVLYIQRLAPADLGHYVVLCRDHAKSRRALGHTLTPTHHTKGSY